MFLTLPPKPPNHKDDASFWRSFEKLADMAIEGMSERGLETPEFSAKLLKQLDDIVEVWNTKGWDFAAYFLNVKEIINYAMTLTDQVGIHTERECELLQALGIPVVLPQIPAQND